MSVEQTPRTTGVERRKIVKGAAWAMPVVAAAVAVPSLAASGDPDFDVAITGTCANNYDLSLLQSLVGPLLVAPVKAALSLLGLKDGATRFFTITAKEGTIPAGTQFQLSNPGLINLTALQGLINTNVAGLVSINGSGIITFDKPLAQGDSVTIDLFKTVLDIGAISTISLSLLPSTTYPSGDQPSNPATAGPNSASITTVLGAAVDLSTLGVFGASGKLAVQLCA